MKRLKKKVEFKGEFTRKQQEIISFLEEGMKPSKMAEKLNITRSMVYKYLKLLRKKGLKVDTFKQGGLVTHCQPFRALKRVRLHGQAFVVKILNSSSKYMKLLGGGVSVVVRDDYTVQLYPKRLLIHFKKSFYGNSVDEATEKSLLFLGGLLGVVGHDLDLLLVKPRGYNIVCVRAHYSELGNELAVDANRKLYKVRVRSVEDGKVWLEVDNSLNFKELETKHPGTSRRDMEDVVVPFFNDLRDNELVTISELKRLLFDILKANKDTALGLSALAQLFRPLESKGQQEEKKVRPEYVG